MMQQVATMPRSQSQNDAVGSPSTRKLGETRTTNKYTAAKMMMRVFRSVIGLASGNEKRQGFKESVREGG